MLRAEIRVPIVLPTEKCARVPLPDNYTFVVDDGVENSFADLVEGGISTLVIRYGFEVGIEVDCDPLHTNKLVEPSEFILVSFYILPAEDKQPLLLWQIGRSECQGIWYNIYTERTGRNGSRSV